MGYLMRMVTSVRIEWSPRRGVVWAPLRGNVRGPLWGSMWSPLRGSESSALTRRGPNQSCIEKGRSYKRWFCGVFYA